MSAVRQNPSSTRSGVDLIALISELGPRFAARAAEHDASESFVAENYAELKECDVFAAGIPGELGGGGAPYPEVCDALRVLAQYCSSTALALAMHTHLVAAIVWRWRRDPQAVEAFLRRVVNERLVLISTGASDWLNGTGKAERVEGGWRVNARKIFGSGVPAGDFLMTGAVCNDPEAGATVLHFPLSLKAAGVRVLDTWHVLGMRATGSHDVAIEGAFVPDSAISARRPQGKWHLLLHLAVMIAWPIVYGVYLGTAEAARDLTVRRAGGTWPRRYRCLLSHRRDGERAGHCPSRSCRYGGDGHKGGTWSGDYKSDHDRPHPGRTRLHPHRREGHGGDERRCSVSECRARTPVSRCARRPLSSAPGEGATQVHGTRRPRSRYQRLSLRAHPERRRNR